MTILENNWVVALPKNSIQENGADVWRGCYEPGQLNLAPYRECLSFEEKNKAGRFVRKLHAQRYIYAHGMLRTILSGYVGCGPDKFRFAVDKFGKPSVVTPEEGRGIQFNLSHSKDMVLVAASRDSKVGIDIEFMRDMDDARQIAERNFSMRERLLIGSLPPEPFKKAFFQCWTLKESFLKAIGKGLQYPLNNFSVLVDNSEGASEIEIDDETGEGRRWKAYSIETANGYLGAVTVEKSIQQVRYFNFYC